MPSTPRRVRGEIRVRHPKYGEKTVARSRLASLSSNWTRVTVRKKTSAKKSDAQPSAPLSATSSAEPDSEQGDADAL